MAEFDTEGNLILAVWFSASIVFAYVILHNMSDVLLGLSTLGC